MIKLNILIHFFFVIFINQAIAVNVYGDEFNLSDKEEKLLKLIGDQCHSKKNTSKSLYPEAFLDEKTYFSCEIISYFEDRHADILISSISSRALLGDGVPRADAYFSWAKKLELYDLSEPTQSLINSYFAGEINLDLSNPKVLNGFEELALNGDLESIYYLILNRENLPRKLDTRVYNEITLLVGQDVTDLLLKSDEELLPLFKDEEKFNSLTKNLISNAGRTSDYNHFFSGYKYYQLFSLIKSQTNSFEFWALGLSSETRKNLLRFNAFFQILEDYEYNFLSLLELNDSERHSLFTVGKKSNVYEYFKESDLFDLIVCLEEFSESYAGLTPTPISVNAICISNYIKLYSDTEDFIKKYYPNIDTKLLSDFDYKDYQNWLLNYGTIENNFYQILAYGDFNYLNYHGIDTWEKNIDVQAKIFLQDNYKKFLHPIIAEHYIAETINHLNSGKTKNTDIKLLNKISNINDWCINSELRICLKLARNINVQNFENKFVKQFFVSLNNNDEYCDVNANYAKALNKLQNVGVFSPFIIQNCDTSEISSIYNFDIKNIDKWFALNFNLPSLGYTFSYLQNEKVYRNQFVAQISSHIHKSTQNKTLIILPYMGLEYEKIEMQNMHLVDRAIQKINPLRNQDVIGPISGKTNLFEEFDYEYNTKPYFALSKLYSYNSNYELALVSSHLNLLRNLKLNDSIDKMSELIYLITAVANARNAGIPEIFLDGYIDRYVKIIEKLSQNNSFASTLKEMQTDGLMIDKKTFSQIEKNSLPILYQYLEGTSLLELRQLIDLQDEKYIIDNFGKFLSATPVMLSSICRDKSTSELILSAIESDYGKKKLNTGMVSQDLVIRGTSLVSECRNSSNWLSELSNSELEKEYNKIIDEITFSISLGLNPIDVRYIDIYTSIAELSNLSGKPFGAVLSLTAAKMISEKMLVSFVERDGGILRNNQKNLEKIFVELTDFVVRNEIERKRSDHFSKQFSYTLNSMIINFHLPLTTTKTRERLIFNGGNKESAYNRQLLNKVNEHFKKVSKNLSLAKDPFEYIALKSQKGNHTHDLIFDKYGIVNEFESTIEGKDFNLQFSKNTAILNLVYGNGKIVLQKTSSSSPFESKIIFIDETKIHRTIKAINLNNEISEEEITAACKIFKPLHIELKELNQKNLRSILLVPSVNLFPIPSEIILGTKCNDEIIPIIHVGDMVAALEIERKQTSWNLPSNFIGVGNPTSKNRGIKMKLNFTLRNAYSNDNIFDLEKMPPLLDAVNEIENSANKFKKSLVLIGENADLRFALNEAEKVSKNNSSVIVFATHGIKPDYKTDITIPGLLSSKNGKLSLIEVSEIEQFSLQDSIVILSACDTAGGFIDNNDLFLTGFTTSFANAGADLILASLWPVYSDTSAKTTEVLFDEWKSKTILDGIKSSKLDNSYKSMPFIYIYP